MVPFNAHMIVPMLKLPVPSNTPEPVALANRPVPPVTT
jgi:hypothetical protein